MAFSQASMIGEPLCAAVGRHLRVSWSSSAPANTLFQVYLDRKLSWSGKARTALFSLPSEPVDIEVGTVGPGESGLDFSSSLPAGNPCRATLDWTADPTVAGFRVYGSAVAGGAVDYGVVLGVVKATVAGVALDGYGVGGYGAAPYGKALANYSWTSDRLGSGVWSFAVQAFDAAGNVSGSPLLAAVTITAPPLPPGAYSDGGRLDAQVMPQGPIGYGVATYGQVGYGSLASGYGTGPYAGGYGVLPSGYGAMPYGTLGYGMGAGVPTVNLRWNASPSG